MQQKTTKKPKKKKRSIGTLPPRKHKRRYVRLNVLPDDLWLKASYGQTIFEALQKSDLNLESDCGGMGRCGKCKVHVLSSLGPPSKEDVDLLSHQEIRQGVRLACRTPMHKDVLIQIGTVDPEQEYYQILKAGERPLIYFDPLIRKRLVTLPPEGLEQGLSHLDRIKLVLGPDHQNITASLNCLQNLPTTLKKTGEHGTAVLHNTTLMAWQRKDEFEQAYGLVFDLGTTTLVGKLIDLNSGAELAAVSRLNSQVKYGSDIISRLKYIKSNRGGLGKVNNLLIQDLIGITGRLLEVKRLRQRDIFIAVAAGNTTMQHILLKIDPGSIAGAPFAPVLTDGLVIKANDLGLGLHPEALLYVMPVRSGYIGGDLISMIIASGASEQEEKIILGLDLGTNGEIFLGNRSQLVTCSAAAGPALEGARISGGMTARTGAIEGVRTEGGKLLYQTIGNIKPKGLCGSGLVDLAAVLLHCGIIDREGLIRQQPAGAENVFNDRVAQKGDICNFLVASQEESFDKRNIFLTQRDVRELQLAKGAVAAGIEILMKEMQIGINDIDGIYLAGALGNYINPYSAMRIGMIPTVDSEKVKSIGNAASTGASMVLLSKSYWQKTVDLSRSISYVELSTHPKFTEHFIANLDFPDTNLW
ncbi:MAG: ASKHA domain-containing protein [Desulfobacterales bacterium]